ncbi:thiamine pyrophosphate-dependent enzyme [Desulfobacula sp.]|uniref:thiamine pyrophosphate-dependent enzyme n=1 Tax=Desulfobacula sp. TaxID=2593537 RepID=UPI0026278E23|nr:thiamine pyrophosphate-dependent enzyme [Desulfobacula sp.]
MPDVRETKKRDSSRVLMMGNEAIAQGVLEGGIAYATGYPGNPSSEIVETLFKYKRSHNVCVEWAVNEIVALEAAAAFSFAGQRAVVTMKQNGMNVCADFLTTVCLNKLPGALLVVVCDDPGPLTSSNEEDSRHFAKIAQIPLFEPSTPQEAKDMAVAALNLSQKYGVPCLLRAVSRLSHGRGPVVTGPVKKNATPVYFDIDKPMVALPFLVTQNHSRLLGVMQAVCADFETDEFNTYSGPEDATTLVIASGQSAVYADEAIHVLNAENTVGLLKIGTVFPLPSQLIIKHLAHAKDVVFAEEVDPFLEEAVKVVYAENQFVLNTTRFFGKRNGWVPGVGEMNTTILVKTFSRLLGKKVAVESGIPEKLKSQAQAMLIPRELSFCQGCPHRASFFAIKTALKLDDRQGFLVGDIGCYGLGAGATGFEQIKALHCMGSGMGNLNGFSRLAALGFDQPVLAAAGDSTFFHAGLPALVNAVHHKMNAVFIILDNSVTAMTGFQINPSTPDNFPGAEQTVSIEKTAEGIGAITSVIDPVADLQKAIDAILKALRLEKGVHVIVFRHPCATYAIKKMPNPEPSVASIDSKKCLAKTCGCNQFCSRILNCPAISVDAASGKPCVEAQLCTGCGLCVQVCPQSAIRLKKAGDFEK